MATPMHPHHDCRVFGAATDQEMLDELKERELEILDHAHIGGLNGVLLSVAAESGMRGACLLGEVPQVFAQFPYPKAALAVLEMFRTIFPIDLDFTELADQARQMDQHLVQLLAQAEKAVLDQSGAGEEEKFVAEPEPPPEERHSAETRQRIEKLFEQSARDRSSAYELKRELDRLGLFHEYEDRFLDLFKKAE